MRILLDTHVFLWWINDDTRLPSRARELIQDGANELCFSVASSWEIAIKAQLGKITFPTELESFIVEQLVENNFSVTPIQLSHTLQVCTLPLLHRDPFDRMLIAQSQVENLPLLTADPLIVQYGVPTIW